MMELPTPETDALDCELHNPRVLQDRYSEMMEHAQKLERERDEAREKLAEAKREAENLARSIYRTEYSDNDTGWELLESVAGVISQINNMYAGVREQRDEARRGIHLMAQNAELWKERADDRGGVMSERPTPETDDAQWGTGKVTTDFARRLERERDEAREDATNYYARIGELESERDELKEIVEQRILVGAEIHNKANSLIKQNDKTEAECERLRRQLTAATSALRQIHLEVGDWIRSTVIVKE